jgi:hypothetical protein
MNPFTTIEVGGVPVTLNVNVSNDLGGKGVKWELALASVPCSPSCGTLKPAPPPSLSAVYTPPTTIPGNISATITVRSLDDARQVFVFNFEVVPQISVSITTKFSSQTVLGPQVNLAATISNDLLNGGLTWTLTAGGVNCSPVCGTLVVDPSPSLTAHYTPPTVPPTGANVSPTITAASVTDPTKNDSFSFTIATPPISITITNPFTLQAVGGGSVTVNASITNDFANAGLTWTLTAGGMNCNSATECGTLTPAAAPSLSAVYTPPAAAPTGADASPTITAIAVTDPTKQASFSFTLVTAASLFNGSYTFLLRGYDSPANAPVAIAGTIVSNGNGLITGGTLDVNDAGTVTTAPGPLSGTFTLDTSFHGIARITVAITNFQLPGTTANFGFKCVLSSDGKRGNAIEYDNSLFLTSGKLLQQDPAALAAANPAGSYAFGLDSDSGGNAGITGRIVEAGQFVLTMGGGGLSVTGGLADASQANAPTPILGPLDSVRSVVSAGAPLNVGSSTATSPNPASGRGTLTLSFPGNGANAGINITTNYAYYIVNAQQLDLIEIDSGSTFHTVQAGTAQLQAPLSASSINSTGVVALTGSAIVTNNGNSVLSSNVVIGQLAIPGTTANTYAVSFDRNLGGTPLNVMGFPPTAGVGTVGFPALTASGAPTFGAFDPTTGRALLASAPFPGVFVGAAAVYLYDTGRGFVVDVTPTNINFHSINYALSGMLIPQAAGPFSIQGDLSGNSIALTGGSSITSVPNIDFAVNFDAASSSFTSLLDLTTVDAAVGASGQAHDINITDPFLLDDTVLGRGRIGFPGGAFGNFSAPSLDVGVFYLIGPNQMVVIEQSGFGPSGVIFFDPQ